MCVFSLAEFPRASGWWMLGVGIGLIVLMFIAPAVGIVATRDAVWFVAVPFWAVRIDLADISAVDGVEVRPLEDFGGWGVKGASRRRGLLLAADGHRAVRIARTNGQVFLATSSDAEAVVILIRSAAATVGSGTGSSSPK